MTFIDQSIENENRPIGQPGRVATTTQIRNCASQIQREQDKGSYKVR